MHRAFVNPILNGEGEEKIAQNGRFFLIQVYTAQQHRFDPCVALIVYTDPTSLDLGKGSCDGVALPGLKINNNAVEIRQNVPVQHFSTIVGSLTCTILYLIRDLAFWSHRPKGN